MSADCSRVFHIFCAASFRALSVRRGLRLTVAILGVLALVALPAHAQFGDEPGHSIGKVTVQGKLILLTLNEGELEHENLFDLAHRTLRFTPDGDGYRVANIPFAWDSDFDAALTSPNVTLKNFAFPFSGKTWTSLSVGTTGTIVFGEAERSNAAPVGKASAWAAMEAERWTLCLARRRGAGVR